jgi:hypothetical protein
LKSFFRRASILENLEQVNRNLVKKKVTQSDEQPFLRVFANHVLEIQLEVSQEVAEHKARERRATRVSETHDSDDSVVDAQW